MAKTVKYLAFHPWVKKIDAHSKYTSETNARIAYKKYCDGKRKEATT